jgi:hypothetical protein
MFSLMNYVFVPLFNSKYVRLHVFSICTEAIRRWLVKADNRVADSEVRDLVLSSVRSMAFAPTEPELAELWDALQRLLTARGLNHVITYIKNEWMTCVKHWSLAHVRWQDHGLVHPCITNNTIERVFRTFKYTVLDQRMNRRVDAILFDAIPRMAAWYYRGAFYVLISQHYFPSLFSHSHAGTIS